MCPDCLKAKGKDHYGIYSLKCPDCRLRLVLNTDCKIHRKDLVESLRKYGEIGDWMVEPHCGCQFTCKRLQAMRGS